MGATERASGPEPDGKLNFPTIFCLHHPVLQYLAKFHHLGKILTTLTNVKVFGKISNILRQIPYAIW